MTTGVVLLNFGEPSTPDREEVVGYLQRIFLANADLEAAGTEETRQARARELAERRVGGLLDEYRSIGGSPLNDQATAQAEALETELNNRGFDAITYVGMQFTTPFIEDAAAAAVRDDVDRIVGLPIYPLCGPSTTVQSLDDLQEALASWEGPLEEITGWHRHPTYNRLRVENVAAFAEGRGVDFTEPDTSLVFSAHGTPQHYLSEGSRYDQYIHEYCHSVANLLGVDEFELGYQNHENRDIPWTEPDVETVIETVEADTVVVEPVSFMHEQSETLSELDMDLRQTAETRGLTFHRVPVPHDDDRFPAVLADLVEPFIAGVAPAYYGLQPCQCRQAPGAHCLNATGPDIDPTDE